MLPTATQRLFEVKHSYCFLRVPEQEGLSQAFDMVTKESNEGRDSSGITAKGAEGAEVAL